MKKKPFEPSMNHWLNPGNYRERCKRSDCQDVLLNCGNTMACGRMYEWAIKHLGVGIYEIYLVERK